MNFKEILKQALREYSQNFDSIFKLMLVLNLIPLTIFALVQNLPDWNTTLLLVKFSLLIPIFLILILAGIYLLGTLIKTPLTKKSYKFKDFFSFSIREYFYFAGFFFVFYLFIFGLFLLLVIPAIIFFIYWIFSAYIFFREKAGILKSLKASRMLVKGKWWRVFGYSFLLGVLFIPIYVVMAPSFLSDILYQSLDPNNISFGTSILRALLSVIVGFTYSLIAYPIISLFYKHFYLVLKNTRN